MIVVDTSAILAILLGEERGEEFSRHIEDQGPALISAGTAFELAAVSSRDARLLDAAMNFLKQAYVQVEPVESDQVAIAAEAYSRFGKGHHPAGLNLGDLFAYALSRHRSLSLLFQGNDFARTDISPVAGDTQRDAVLSRADDKDNSPVIHQRIRSRHSRASDPRTE